MRPTLKRAAGVGLTLLGLLLPCPLMAGQLFPDGAGWYREGGNWTTAAQRHLYWTTDWGAHWQDITPPIPDRYQLGEVFFLDRSSGWVFLDPLCGARNGFAHPDLQAGLKLAFTRDSGKNWTTTDVRLPDSSRHLALADGLGCVTFADAKHGWARIGFADPSYDLLLLTTKDGGRSWKSLSNDPSKSGCVRFTNAKEGWMTDPSSGSLRVWKTEDGGRSWLDVSPSVPDAFGNAFGDYGIVIENRKRVSVAAYFMPSTGDQIRLFLTEDGGLTWKGEIALPTRGGWNHDALGLLGSSIIRGELSKLSREAPKQTLTLTTFTAKGLSKTQQAEAPSLPPFPESDLPACPTELSGLNMIDENHGWAYVRCGITDMLFATVNAGGSWSDVSPAAVPEMTDYRFPENNKLPCQK
jgi:photosystem II stability/assembly factor-like uncharacterized protein